MCGMKNFLIIVLALGLVGAAFLTRPDREEFERFLADRRAERQAERREASADNVVASIFRRDKTNADRDGAGPKVDLDDDDVEFKDFYLWTVVREKGGKTLYTGVFDRWIDNEQVRQSLPS